MKLITLIFSLLLYTSVYSQDFSQYHKETFSNNQGYLPYRILYPSSFDTTSTYPLLIFLHGAYEKGTDNEAQLQIGGRYFLRDENRKDFPAIILFPQCPPDDSWAYFTNELDTSSGFVLKLNFPFLKHPTTSTAILKALLDSLLSRHFIDRSRIYIGGLSQGGMGVFDIVARYPDLFAAAFPICGAGNIGTSKYFASKVSLWIFHGADDDVIPVYFSRDYFKRLTKLRADVRYSEYPGIHHNSWVNAFAEKDLLSWLFSKSKKK